MKTCKEVFQEEIIVREDERKVGIMFRAQKEYQLSAFPLEKCTTAEIIINERGEVKIEFGNTYSSVFLKGEAHQTGGNATLNFTSPEKFFRFLQKYYWMGNADLESVVKEKEMEIERIKSLLKAEKEGKEHLIKKVKDALEATYS